MTDITLMQGDCLELMERIPDGSVDLVLTDPPYNIGVTTRKGNKQFVNSWDKIDGYIDWCIRWLQQCERVLKPNGVLYFWHNDMAQIAELLEVIKRRTHLAFRSFCIWDKGDAFRARSWHHRDPEGKTALRSWFSVCEYCLHFFNAPKDAESHWKHTGLDRIHSNPECFRPLKAWYTKEKERLGLTEEDVSKQYMIATGRKPHMLRHYFRDSQFEIPTRAVFESVYEPLGFRIMTQGRQGYEAMRQEYEAMRQEYEAMRQEYEAMRHYHRCDDMHCNVWHVPPIPSQKRYHTCQKPEAILERLIRVSCRPGGVVLDPFMGSGSTGVACINTGRKFVGVELDPHYFEVARDRIAKAQAELAES
ncbi:DNA-methyltransferase [Gehongia tenuis]|uniref:Methyltransferase n=1 Tax=Gehongia tenuis TaxID=2763655 RepID=A0A926D6L1_9FIRM|nr:site-specific DNA-methyltransferase [Gehongia tenuis]MBC8531794.1 site-specific DNA-methyltransferase [Gehongia tenuis]